MNMRAVALALCVCFGGLVAPGWAGAPAAWAAKKKKKVKDEPAPAPAPAEPAPPEPAPAASPEPAQPSEPAAAPIAADPAADERTRVEGAKKKLKTEGRKQSQITPGTASRWSNRGAMTPIVSEVPITAVLPQRAIPIAAGAETPGQALIGSEELLQLRVSLYAYHLQTSGQDLVFKDAVGPDMSTPALVLQGMDRDIDLLRGRASAAYEHIGGSDVGAHLDLEYRSRIAGTRPTDYRVNELYISYGLTDFRGRQTGPDFGISVGRVAVREAGYARSDGAALRLRASDDLHLGIFGGFTGNPYGYNWLAHQTQDFSLDWINGGAFFGYRSPRFFANLAGVATIARLPALRDRGGGVLAPAKSGLDRLYVYTDIAYLATESIDVFLLGWVDIIGGNPFQSLQGVVAYRPSETADFRLALGRFSTITYESSTAYSYERDPQAAKGDPALSPNATFVDDTGKNIVPFDAALQTAVYNSLTLRAGYEFMREAEAFVVGEALLRDTTKTDNQTLAATGGRLQFSALRMVPTAGARYRNPAIIDASLQGSYIADKDSQASAVLQATIGRGFEGLYGSFDVRHYFGTIDATDGGIDLSYTLPRDWFPGRVMIRGMLHYYIENVALARPLTPLDATGAMVAQDQIVPSMNNLLTSDSLAIIPKQESWLGFAGLEWRL